MLGLGEFRNDATQETLDRCRWDFRDWEYNYLSRKVNGARLIIEKAATIVTALAFNGGGDRIVAGCGTDIVVFDARTGGRLFKGSGHAAEITAAACATSVPFAVTVGKDRVARVWDLKTLGKSRTFSGHKAVITCAVVSTDGNRVATGDASGTVIVWKADTLQEVCRLAESVPPSRVSPSCPAVNGCLALGAAATSAGTTCPRERSSSRSNSMQGWRRRS